MARQKYTKVGITGGYAHLATYLGRDGVDSVFEGYVSEYAYGKKGKTFTTHNLRSWKEMSFWLGEEAYSMANMVLLDLFPPYRYSNNMMRRRDEMDRKFTLQDVLGAVVFTLLMYSFAFVIALTN